MARKKFHLKVISPERIFYEGDAEMVELETTEGEMGVYADHVPTTAVIVPGVLYITEEDERIKEAAVHDGFIEILQDKITILAQSSEWPEEIDIKRAEEAKIRAERRIDSGSSDINLARAEHALRKSLTRLRVAGNK